MAKVMARGASLPGEFEQLFPIFNCRAAQKGNLQVYLVGAFSGELAKWPILESVQVLKILNLQRGKTALIEIYAKSDLVGERIQKVGG